MRSPKPWQDKLNVLLLSLDPQISMPASPRSLERLGRPTEGVQDEIAKLAHHRKLGASSTSQRYRMEIL